MKKLSHFLIYISRILFRRYLKTMSLSYNSLCLRKRDAFRLQLQFSDSKRASFKIIAIVLLFAFCPNHTWANSYQVHIEGIQNDELLRIIDSSSQLKKLQDSPPSTSLGLKRRAEGDIANIIDALHSRAYYGASVDLSIAESIITLHIDPGPIYPLSAFNIRYMQNEVEI